jgi:hypothetical protein
VRVLLIHEPTTLKTIELDARGPRLCVVDVDPVVVGTGRLVGARSYESNFRSRRISVRRQKSIKPTATHDRASGRRAVAFHRLDVGTSKIPPEEYHFATRRRECSALVIDHQNAAAQTDSARGSVHLSAAQC